MNDEPKLDLTKPIQRRNGWKIDFFRVLNGDRTYKIIAIGPDTGGRDDFTTHQLDGRVAWGADNDMDIVNVPEKRMVWVYETHDRLPNGPFVLAIRNERSNTLDNCCRSRIRVEFEVGRKDE